MSIERSMILGVLLAGGQSRRMGHDKAFAPLGGRPMLRAVAGRLRPQVGATIISAGADPARFGQFGWVCVPDPQEFLDMGPAAGVLAGLRYAGENGFAFIATVPCDAPFAPAELVARLVEGLGSGIDVCVAESAGRLQPAFALSRAESALAVEAALRAGERSLHSILARLSAARVRFEPTGDVDAFWNVNSPADLALANDLIARRGSPDGDTS